MTYPRYWDESCLFLDYILYAFNDCWYFFQPEYQEVCRFHSRHINDFICLHPEHSQEADSQRDEGQNNGGNPNLQMEANAVRRLVGYR